MKAAAGSVYWRLDRSELKLAAWISASFGALCVAQFLLGILIGGGGKSGSRWNGGLLTGGGIASAERAVEQFWEFAPALILAFPLVYLLILGVLWRNRVCIDVDGIEARLGGIGRARIRWRDVRGIDISDDRDLLCIVRREGGEPLTVELPLSVVDRTSFWDQVEHYAGMQHPLAAWNERRSRCKPKIGNSNSLE